MEGAGAERTHRQSLGRGAAKRLIQAQCLRLAGGPPGEQEANVLSGKPPERECESDRRRRVEPLDVVDGDQDRLALAETVDDIAQGEGERALIDRIAFRLSSQRCDLESTSPRRGE